MTDLPFISATSLWSVQFQLAQIVLFGNISYKRVLSICAKIQISKRLYSKFMYLMSFFSSIGFFSGDNYFDLK